MMHRVELTVKDNHQRQKIMWTYYTLIIMIKRKTFQGNTEGAARCAYCLFLAKILSVRSDHSAVDLCVHNPPGGWSVKVVNNVVVSRYPSHSLAYSAVDSGLAAAECILCEWAWLAKTCARVKCRFKERAELSC